MENCKLTKSDLYGIDSIEVWESGKNLIDKLTGLDLKERLLKYSFNPRVENYSYTFTEPLPGLDDDVLAFEVSNLDHQEYDFEIIETLILDWFTESMFGCRFPRWNSKSVVSNYGKYTNHYANQYTEGKRIYKSLSKIDITLQSTSYVVYCGSYSMGQGGDPSYCIISRSDLDDLICIANEVYPFTNYLLNRIKEKVAYNWLGNLFHGSPKYLAYDEVFNEVINALDFNYDSWDDFINR